MSRGVNPSAVGQYSSHFSCTNKISEGESEGVAVIAGHTLVAIVDVCILNHEKVEVEDFTYIYNIYIYL